MTEDSWEHRMAARTRDRWVPDIYQPGRQRLAELREIVRAGRAYHAGMTLGEAVEWLDPANSFACACTGGPWCCRWRTEAAEALKRAAHIAVKLMAERSGGLAS